MDFFKYEFIYTTPTQLKLSNINTAGYDIIWKAKSAYTDNDTIIGYGDQIIVPDIDRLKQETNTIYCFTTPCPPSQTGITIEQISSNMWCRHSTSRFIIIDNPTSIENTRGNSIKIFPNPSKGTIHFEGAERMQTMKYEVYNLLGAKVTQGNCSEKPIRLDVKPGIYFIKAHNGKKIIIQEKIIIE